MYLVAIVHLAVIAMEAITIIAMRIPPESVKPLCIIDSCAMLRLLIILQTRETMKFPVILVRGVLLQELKGSFSSLMSAFPNPKL